MTTTSLLIGWDHNCRLICWKIYECAKTLNICLLTVFLYQYYTFLFLQNKIYFCYRGSHIIYLSSFTSPFFIEILIMKFRVWFELFQVQEQIFLPSLSSFRIVRMLKITTFKITGLNRLQFHIGFHQYKLYWVIWGQNISQMSFPSLADLTPQHIHSTNQHILNKKCNSLKLFC